MFAAFLIPGCAWLYFGVLNDALSQDPLVVVDVVVSDHLQELRTPMMDLLIAGGVHIANQHASDLLRYSPATDSER